MPKIRYADISFKPDTVALIEMSNRIIEEYERQDFILTLRQLYYQMVARDIIPNTVQSYKRLGSIITDARMAGLVDWFAIEDRTRILRGNTHWSSPVDIARAAIDQYKIDRWANQPHRVEVWIEKDALAGVVDGVCRRLDVDYFSCRGYTSASEMWRAAGRLMGYLDAGQTPVILHFGDHDPSGIDMTRDIVDRLEVFTDYAGIEVRRVALNIGQIKQYGPPPNPAKLTDSRAGQYVVVYGLASWELDALEPRVIVDLIEQQTLGLRDANLWAEAADVEAYHKQKLDESIKNGSLADVTRWPAR